MNDVDLLGVAEAADVIGVTRRQVARLARDGRLPFVYKNPTATGAYVFRWDDVEAYAAKRRERAA